jgi:hypothetical protein
MRFDGSDSSFGRRDEARGSERAVAGTGHVTVIRSARSSVIGRVLTRYTGRVVPRHWPRRAAQKNLAARRTSDLMERGDGSPRQPYDKPVAPCDPVEPVADVVHSGRKCRAAGGAARRRRGASGSFAHDFAAETLEPEPPWGSCVTAVVGRRRGSLAKTEALPHGLSDRKGPPSKPMGQPSRGAPRWVDAPEGTTGYRGVRLGSGSSGEEARAGGWIGAIDGPPDPRV